MEMTDSEIVRNYNASRKKTLQIGILADLNTCSKQRIADILIAAGIKVPEKFYHEKKAMTPEKPKEVEVTKETLAKIGYEELERLEKEIRQQEKIIEQAQALKMIYEEDYKVMLKFLGIGK